MNEFYFNNTRSHTPIQNSMIILLNRQTLLRINFHLHVCKSPLCSIAITFSTARAESRAHTDSIDRFEHQNNTHTSNTHIYLQFFIHQKE